MLTEQNDTDDAAKRRKRRTLEERQADLEAELEEVKKMRLLRYKEKVTEAVAILEAVGIVQGIPPDLSQTVKNVLPLLKKHAG